MKIIIGILVLAYLGLTIFGLYQCKAHNRRWAAWLVPFMSGIALVVGLGMSMGRGWLLGRWQCSAVV